MFLAGGVNESPYLHGAQMIGSTHFTEVHLLVSLALCGDFTGRFLSGLQVSSLKVRIEWSRLVRSLWPWWVTSFPIFSKELP